MVIIKIALFRGVMMPLTQKMVIVRCGKRVEKTVIRRFMIVLFTIYCSKTLILRSCILNFEVLYALFVWSQLNACKNSAFHISYHF